jgi:5-deoxy-glucuronate isomerase
MRYHFSPADLREGVGPEHTALDWLSCRRIELDGDASTLAVETGREEVVLACIGGLVDYDLQGTTGTAAFQDLLYVPWNSKITVQAVAPAVVMRIGAPADRDTEFFHIRFSDVERDPVRHKVFGTMAERTFRDVYMYIDDKFDASRILMGIGRGGPACWTVWPPHEHGDEKEELYVYFDMGDRFGIQCVYESLEDPTFCGIVRDGDMVTVPRGFHPNVGCPGGGIAYLYVMAAREAGQREFMALRFQDEFGDSF